MSFSLAPMKGKDALTNTHAGASSPVRQPQPSQVSCCPEVIYCVRRRRIHLRQALAATATKSLSATG